MGLTVVLTYRDGKLYKAVTRGNGEVGEVDHEQCESIQKCTGPDCISGRTDFKRRSSHRIS